MAKTFSGSTEDAKAPVMAAADFKKGLVIEGSVLRTFKTEVGLCYTLSLKKPISVPSSGEKGLLDQISIGSSMKGLQMALRAANIPEINGLPLLVAGDLVRLECTGFDQSTKEKGNAMVMFKVSVARPDDADGF